MDGIRIDLKDKVALITGGTRGLGRQIAEAYAEAGATLVIASRSTQSCEETAKALSAKGIDVLAVPCDVGVWTDCDTLVDAAYDRFGRVDILVNNAGMSPVLRSPADVTEAMFDEIVNVNLKGLYRLSALVCERMAVGNGGSVINVSSTASVITPPAVAPYAAIKAGVNAATKAFAKAYGPKVRVNCIMCGPFRTDLTASFIDSEPFQKGVKMRVPLRRVGEPDEIAGAALYFASDQSSFTSGAILTLDGGET